MRWSYGGDVATNGPLYEDAQERFLSGSSAGKSCDAPKQPVNPIFEAL